MTKHSEKTIPSNSTKPVLAVVINKTIGGFEIKDFKVLEKPIDRHILEPHIYEGIIVLPRKTEHNETIEDVYCTWDRFGKCSNWKRSDCFIDVSGL